MFENRARHIFYMFTQNKERQLLWSHLQLQGHGSIMPACQVQQTQFSEDTYMDSVGKGSKRQLFKSRKDMLM